MERLLTHARSTKSRSSSTSGVESTSGSSLGNKEQDVPQTEMKDNYRCVVMGAAGVGKTCIINRFLHENFISEYKATVEELHRGEYEINGVSLTLDILDTSGAFPFPAMRKLSIRTGDAFVLVYSIDDEASFEEVRNIREQIIEEKGSESVPIVVVGNKIDKENIDTTSTGSSTSNSDNLIRPVEKETAESTANLDWGSGYVEASAKDDTNIVGIFKELLAQAKVQYALSPAVRRRRQSAPSPSRKDGKSKKRNSCTMS